MRSESLRGWLVLSCLVGYSLVGPASEAAVYYVDPQSGAPSEQGAGTQRVATLTELTDRLKPGDSVYLTSGIYRSPEVIGARGTADLPITIGPVPNQEAIIERTTWKLEQAQHVVLTGLIFRDCAPALELLENASYNTIEKNRFLNCPPLRLALKQATPWERALWGRGPNAHYNRIRGNQFKRNYEGAHSVNESLNIHEGNRFWLIQDNHIEGYMYGLQLGIGGRGGPPAYTLVRDNHITRCNNGLHIKTGDNQIRGNYIADMQSGYRGCGTGIYLRSCPRTVVENNRIERAQWAGIRVLGSNQLIRNNIVIDTPVGVWLTHHSYGRARNSNWVVHNTIAGATLPVWIESEGEAFVFNNILAANGRDASPTVGIYVAGSHNENPMRASEKWYKRMAGRNSEPPGHLVASHNLYFNTRPPDDERATTSQPVASGEAAEDDNSDWWGGYNVVADPSFVEPRGGDWRLKPDSPARGAGRPLPNAALDIDDVLRLNRPDLGACQTDNAAGVTRPSR